MASVAAAHALLQVWLDLKRQAQDVLRNTYYEQEFLALTFARHCLEAARCLPIKLDVASVEKVMMIEELVEE